jgi:NAD(P)-dependent dehydrogenase (short-subunit alcohol dehydrogenase family)
VSAERTVAVITGGAGGMGLATAKLLGPEHRLLLSDVSADRLDVAVSQLTGLGFEAEQMISDVTDRESVDGLMRRAATLGEIAIVLHTAGVSPQMTDAERIVRINALGTVNVTSAFAQHVRDGSRIVNVASMAAHIVPNAMAPTRAYRYASSDPERFMAAMMRRINVLPKSQRPSAAYPFSKHFVVWYSKHMAATLGAKGARIVSVSPGSIDTEMGRLEEKNGGGALLKFAAIKRLGTVQEIAGLLAFCASERASYLTGVDILCDGGTIAGVGWMDLLKLER